MRKFTIIATSALTAAVLSVTSYAGTPTEKGQMPYLKPGASVSLSHNYDGKTIPGEIENIAISLKDGYDSGTLTVTILPTSGLTIHFDIREHIFSMSGNVSHDLDVQVSAGVDGVYYLNLQMVAADGTGNVMRRSGGIAIYVGANARPQKQQALIQASPDVAGEPGLIVMDAEEEIIIRD